MNLRLLFAASAVTTVTFAFAADHDNPIKKAMNFAHKAPKGEQKLSEKIVEGTAEEADIKKALELYKAMADAKPPKGDPSAFKDKTNKLVLATEEVLTKKPDAAEHYKLAVDCKGCHSDFRKMPPGGPGGPGFGPGGPPRPR